MTVSSRFFPVVSFVALITSSSANDIPNFGNFGQGGKVCPSFRCSKGYEAVPRRPMKFTSSGCGSAMSGMQVFSPGSNENDPAEPCCDQHSACYQICGASKTTCDEKLKTCNEEVCDAITDEAEQKKCKTNAELTQMMLNMSDCNRFDSSQREACECVDASKAADKREAAIRYFYKKFSPENVGKVSSLAKKADTKTKLAGLFQKLLLKYPEAIKKIKDPKQKLMEDMMNKIKEEKKDDDADEEEDDEPDEVQEL